MNVKPALLRCRPRLRTVHVWLTFVMGITSLLARLSLYFLARVAKQATVIWYPVSAESVG